MFATEVAGTAYRFFFANLKTFAKIGSPFIGLLLAAFIYMDVSGKSLSFGREIADALFAFYWHRFYLLGRERAWNNTSKDARDAEGKAQWRFILWSVLLVLVVSLWVVGIGLFLVSSLLGREGPVLAFYLLMLPPFLVISPWVFRILPFFPAVAVGKVETTIRGVLEFTRGNTIRIWLSFFLAIAPFVLLAFFADLALASFYDWEAPTDYPRLIAIDFLYATLNVTGVAIGVSANSEIFRRLSGWEQPTTGALAQGEIS